MKRFYIFTILTCSLLLTRCSNELDILSEYQEKIVCYGILNPDDSIHYIKVSKIFLGEGNALAMAQVQDSIALRPENCEVRIVRILNGIEMSYWTLEPDSSIPREAGVFLNPHQILYRGIFPVFVDGSTYKLTITDLRTGVQAYSETQVVRNVVQTDPASVWQQLNFEDTTVASFKFLSPTHGKRYELTIRFYYQERFIFDTTQISEKYVDWIVGQTESISTTGGENLAINVRRDNFFRVLANKIPVNNTVTRISGRLDFIYLSVSDDLVTYIKVQEANQNTSADLPPFTNIFNGIGLFTTRTTTTIPNFHLDIDTQYALTTSLVVKELNFIR